MSDTKRELVLVGLGEVLWDLLPSGKQLGGAPANFAYHATALGARGYVASSVGNDELGREILARLDDLGLDRGAVAVDGSGHPTGTVTVELDDAGKPTYAIHENVAWDFIPAGDGLLQLARRADAVCYGSLAQRCDVSAATIRSFLAATPAGCLRIFDINLRQAYYSRGVIEASLQVGDVLKLNDEELPVLVEMFGLPGGGGGGEIGSLRSLAERFSLRSVVLTRGAAGSVVIAGEDVSDLSGTSVEVADTVGAGDSFTAAIAMGLLQGVPVDDLHRHAVRVAGYVCTQSGATPMMPERLRRFSE